METMLILEEAKRFIHQCYEELERQAEIESRLNEIEQEIMETGTYIHTYEELAHGAKMAWRNSNRCIGRLFWQSLHVFDERKIDSVDQIQGALERHVKFATNEGKIRPTITIFKQYVHENNQIRIWNHQLIRYAGYETETGVVGDSSSLAFTKVCEQLGWKGQQEPFDILPIVVQWNQERPIWFMLDKDLINEVPIVHPELEWFQELELKWYAVPMISDMKLEIGGITYTAAPFNGWYMGTEIGARNFADTSRYNMLPKIAEKMGLDTSKNANLWKDRALVELNVAVLHSYKNKGVSIVDHHTAAAQFHLFEKAEQDAKRPLTGDWTWLIPPMSPATTHIFHRGYKNQVEKPNYFPQSKPYYE